MGVVLMAKRLYDSQVKPYLTQVKEMAQQGLSQVQIADALKISSKSLERYIKEEEDLKQAIYSGRDVAIKEVENALYKSAVGEKIVLKKGMKVKKVLYEGGRRQEIEVVEPYDEEIYIKPDTQAGIFLLKNWDKEHYSSDPKLVELKEKEQERKQKEFEYNLEDDFNPFS